jgi:hypothetical protein
MHEPLEENRMSKTQWKAPHYGAGAGLLVVGLLAGRAFFPLEIPKPFIVEKEMRVEVPVERIIEQKVPYEVIKYVDRVVEKRVEVPVEKVVTMRVEVPIEKIVEKRVEVPVDRIVYRDRIVDKSFSSVPAGLSAWRRITKSLSRDQVRAILGEPRKIEGGTIEIWFYGSSYLFGASSSVNFGYDGVIGWYEP